MTKHKLFNCGFLNLRVAKMLLASVFIVLLVSSGNAVAAKKLAAPITITGKVMDERGETIIGATIKSSAGGGAVTDANGSYSLTTESNATLTVSYLGYVSQEVKVNNRTKINITLVPAPNQLNDVVVVGYGTQKRKDVTGAITTVKLEGGPKESVPLINPLEAIQGTPGINVGPSTTAGATPNIVVRGQNSITASSNPLIVLDGVIFNGDLNQINMNDVSSFDILKDASSAAIYGSRSQNGVILITTKRGKTDKPQINFNTYYGTQSWTRVPEMRNGEQYIQWRTDLAKARGNNPADVAAVIGAAPLELQAYNAGYTTDWIKDIQQDAPVQNYDVNISGRTDKVNYYFSAGYIKQKGVLANDNYSKPNLTLKVENTINDWLSYGINGYYSSRDYSGIPADLYMATYLSPYSYKYVDGTNNTLLQRYPQGNGSNFNPYWGNAGSRVLGSIDDNVEKYNSIRGTGFINVKFPFVKGLSYRLSLNGERSGSNIANFHHESGEVNTLLPGNIANPSQFLASAYGNKLNGTTVTYLLDNLLTYDRQLGDHHFDALIGYTRDDSKTEELSATGTDYASFGSSVLGIYGLNNATTQRAGSTFSEFSNVGYIGRLNYNYKSRYFATFNFRRDGYSAFVPGRKFGNFPGASVAWALSEEGFMKNITAINNLKIRASYGRTGNQGISPYKTQATVGSTAGTPGYPNPGYVVFGPTSYQYTFPSQLGNKNLTWEKTSAFNLGLDFSLLNNRIWGSIEAYKSSTKDQLITRLIPNITGYDQVQDNLGQVDNKGIEVTINSINLKTESGFKWESGFAFWMNRNKLVHLNYIINPLTGKENDDTGNSLFIGKSLGAVYDYTFDGIVQSSDAAYIAANGALAGDVKFRDISGPDGTPDGKITAADRSVIGYGKENFNMNLSNTFTYKNFQLFFSLNGIFGGGKDNFFISTNLRGLNPGAVTIGNWLNLPYWTPDNPGNEYPRPNYGNPLLYGFYQSRTFVRLQNASLSYLFPKNITEKLKVANLKAYVSGTNLFTITGWTGLDPANAAQIGGNGGSSNSAVNKSQPIMRAFTFGLNVGF
jgi:TonB-linked SusC/RagA family outer membrane protein